MNQPYEVYPLTQSQKRIWFTQMIYSTSHMFNIGGIFKIEGNIDIKILRKAMELFRDEHDAFQIRLCMKENQPYQYFTDENKKEICFVDFSESVDKEKEFSLWLKKASQQCVFGEHIPLYTLNLFKMDSNHYGYFVLTHHIISDGWSMQILTNEISKNYEELIHGSSNEPRDKYSYKDYIFSQERYFQSAKFTKDKEFWLEKYRSLPDEMSVESSDIQGNRKTYYVDEPLRLKIENYCTENNISKNTFFVGIYLMYLYKATGKEDLIIGTPFLGRKGVPEKNTYGMFVSSLPFRYQLDSENCALSLFQKVKKDLLNCYCHYAYPYNYLINEVGHDSNSFYTECVNYYNTQMPVKLGECETCTTEFYNGEQEYDRQLVFKDWNDTKELQIDVDYKTKVYLEEDIDQMIDMFYQIIDEICIDVDKKIKDIHVLNDDEKKMWMEFNRTDVSYTYESVVAKLKEQVKQCPQKIVMYYDKDAMTYAELDRKSDHLAAYIRQQLPGNENIIAIAGRHSFDIIISILAVLKSGNAYVPIDPSLPSKRIEYMIKDAQIDMLITNMYEHFSKIKVNQIIDLDNFNNDLSQACESETYLLRGDSKAYIIYTSGTTGNPKGVVISHRALFNYIEFARQQYVSNMDDVFPLFTSLSFDLTVTSIFTPLVSGCGIDIYDNEDMMQNLRQIFWNSRCTVVKLTPAHLGLIANDEWKESSVKVLVVGGDNFVGSLAEKISMNSNQRIQIYNEYGPTEATVGCMIHLYDAEKDRDGSVPIGRAITNMKVLILDKDYNQVPKNVAGEMYLAGAQIADGYLNNEEITKKSFIYMDQYKEYGVLYRTGDLAKLNQDHVMIYLGRGNQQVKINGYRVELKEIENNLCQYPKIDQVVVTIYQRDEQTKQLIAYYVSSVEISNKSFQEFLATRLPFYMIPNVFVRLEKLPCNRNGKVDLSKLPIPKFSEENERRYGTNTLEKVLLQSLSNVLNCDVNNMNDNFFYLGGDSVKAIQLSGTVKESGYDLKIKDILKHPVLNEMVHFMKEPSHSESMVVEDYGNIIMTPIMKNYLKGEHNIKDFTQSIVIELKDYYKTSILQTMLDLLIQQHDSLRMNYNQKDHTIFCVDDCKEKDAVIEEYDDSDQSLSGIEEKLSQIQNRLKQSLDIEREIPVKAAVVRTKSKDVLVITIHHFCIDGISWRIVLREFELLCEQYKKNQSFYLGNKTSSFQSWSRLMDQRNVTSVETEYWTNIIKEASILEHPSLHYDETECHTIVGYVNKELTTKLLKSVSEEHHVRPDEILVAALAETFSDEWKENKWLFQFENNGRYHEFVECDISKTTGWFTCMYPSMITVDVADTKNTIQIVKNRMRSVPNYGIGFGYYQESKTMFELEKNCIRFNYLGEFEDEYELIRLDIDRSMPFILPKDTDCLSEVNILCIGGQLNIYLSSHIAMDQLVKLRDGYINRIQELLNEMDQSDYKVTPLDFENVKLSQDDLDLLFK